MSESCANRGCSCSYPRLVGGYANWSQIIHGIGRLLKAEAAQTQSQISCLLFLAGRVLWETYALDSDSEKYGLPLNPSAPAPVHHATPTSPVAEPLLVISGTHRHENGPATGYQEAVRPSIDARRASEPYVVAPPAHPPISQSSRAAPAPSQAEALEPPLSVLTPEADTSYSTPSIARHSSRLQAASDPKTFPPTKRVDRPPQSSAARRLETEWEADSDREQMPNILPQPSTASTKQLAADKPVEKVGSEARRRPKGEMKEGAIKLSPGSRGVDRHAFLHDLMEAGIMLDDAKCKGFVNWFCCDLLGQAAIQRLTSMILRHRNGVTDAQLSSMKGDTTDLQKAPEAWGVAIGLCELSISLTSIGSGGLSAQRRNLDEFKHLTQAANAISGLRSSITNDDKALIRYLKELGALEQVEADKRGSYYQGLLTKGLSDQLSLAKSQFYVFQNKAKAAQQLVRHYGVGIASVFHPMSRLQG